MNQDNCIFCKIVKGDISSYKVYEDKNTFAFLDINPTSEGHTLVIPKNHFENIYDIDEKTLKDIMTSVKKITSLYKEKLNIKECNIVNANGKSAQQSVAHIHFHIVPRFEKDGMDLWFHKKDNIKTKNDFESFLKRLK